MYFIVAKASKVHFYITNLHHLVQESVQSQKNRIMNGINGQSLIGIAHFKLEFSFSVLIFFNEFSSIELKKRMCAE